MAERERGSESELLDAPAAPIDETVTSSPDAIRTEPAAEPTSEPTSRDAAQDDTTQDDAAAVEAVHGEPSLVEPAEVEPAEVQASEARAAERTPLRRQLPVLLVAAVLAFVVDLVTKLLAVAHLSDRAPVVVVPKVLDLQLTRNPGAAFGLAGGATIIFTVVAVAVVVFIAVTARRLRSAGWAVALGLLLGGALGNLGDRLFRNPGPLRGHVVDWIHLTHWPIFNVADSCIVVGGVLAVVLSLLGRRLDGTIDSGR